MPTLEIPIFLCYRRNDGKDAAPLVYQLINNRTIRLQNDEEGEIKVFYDQQMDGYSDWTEHHKPALQRARAMIILITPGLAADLNEKGKPDWVRTEIEWWRKNRRNVEPILIDCTGEGTRFIPGKAKEQWEKVQVLPLDLAGLTEKEVLEKKENLVNQVLGGIREREGVVRYEDVERLSRLVARYKRAIIGAGVFGVIAVVASVLLTILLQRSRIERDNARAMSWVSEAEKDATAYPTRSLDLIAEALEVAPENTESANRATEEAFDLFAHQRGKEYEGVELPTSSAITGDGRWLAVGNYKGTLVIWDRKRQEKNEFFTDRASEENPGAILSLQYTADGRYLLILGELERGSKDVWLGEIGPDIHSIRIRRLGIKDVAVLSADPTGNWFCIGHKDGRVSFYRLSGSEPFSQSPLDLGAHPGPITAMAWSMDGKRFASGAVDGSMRLWDLRQDPDLRHSIVYPHPEGEVSALSFSASSYADRYTLFSATGYRWKRTASGWVAGVDTSSKLRMWGLGDDEHSFSAFPAAREVQTSYLQPAKILPVPSQYRVCLIGRKERYGVGFVDQHQQGMATYKTNAGLVLESATEGDYLLDAALSPDSTEVEIALVKGGIEERDFSGPNFTYNSGETTSSIATWAGGVVYSQMNGRLNVWGKRLQQVNIAGQLVDEYVNDIVVDFRFNSNSSRLVSSVSGTNSRLVSWNLGQKITSGVTLPSSGILEDLLHDGQHYFLHRYNTDSSNLICLDSLNEIANGLPGVPTAFDRPSGLILLGRPGEPRACSLEGLLNHQSAACQSIRVIDGSLLVIKNKDTLMNARHDAIADSTTVDLIARGRDSWKPTRSLAFAGRPLYFDDHWLALEVQHGKKGSKVEVWNLSDLSRQSPWLNGPYSRGYDRQAFKLSERWMVVSHQDFSDQAMGPYVITFIDLTNRTSEDRTIAANGAWASLRHTDNTIYVGTNNGLIWRARPGSPKIAVDSFAAHDRGVHSIAISQNGKMLVSGDEGGVIKVWNLEDLKVLPLTIQAFAVPVNKIAISDDNRWIAVSGDDRGAKVYCLDRKLLDVAARQYAGRPLSPDEKKRFGVD